MDDGLNRATSKELGNLRPALAYLWPYKRQMIIASFALVVTATVTLSIGQGLRIVIDAVSTEGGAAATALLGDSLTLFGALVLLLTVGTFVRFYYVSWIGERVSADIRTAVFDRLIHLHPGYFEQNQPTEIQSRITTDTTLLQTVIGSSVSIALRNILMFFGGVVLLFITNVKLSLIVLLCVPLVVLPLILFGRRVRQLSRSSQDRLADVGSYAGESLRHIKVVQAFNHQEEDKRLFLGHVERAFFVAVRRIKQRAWLIALVMLLVMSALSTMVWVGGQDVLTGNITSGELGAFIFYAFIVAGSVGAISEVYSDLQRAAGATERLVELLNAESDLREPDVPRDIEGAVLELELQNVSFAYPTRPNAMVLDSVAYGVSTGEMVALVGPSGAGKSTLFDLILRFYDPTDGRVCVNGIDVRDVRSTELRERIGLVPQEPVLFAGTLEDNLRYGLNGFNREATEADLHEALRLANAEAFVQALPEGLQTKVGEDGTGLSGGQKQRLAIARALVCKPAMLLLDEATSALDADSERAIRSTIERLKGQCSILVIAHRLSTVRQADRILVLDGGQLVASGTHEQLLQDSDLYARFSGIQFGEGQRELTETDAARRASPTVVG